MSSRVYRHGTKSRGKIWKTIDVVKTQLLNRNGYTYPTIETYADWEIENCLSCAEDAFLQGDPQKAIELFDQSIDFCEKKGDSDVRIVRALFGHLIAQAYLGEETAALSDVALLDKAIRQFQCEEAASNVYLAYGKPILGEDKISIEDCVKRVENTVKGIDQILAASPLSLKVRAGLIALLRLVEHQATQCCSSGGIWKACLQPLLEKWLELKDIDREWRYSGKGFIVPSWD